MKEEKRKNNNKERIILPHSCRNEPNLHIPKIFLYHVPNLSKILAPYDNIMTSSYYLENHPETKILVNKIETLKNQ